MTSSTLKEALSLVTNSVSIVAVNSDNKVFGCTISSLQAIDVSKENPRLIFILKKGSELGNKLQSTKEFSINALSADQSELAGKFWDERDPQDIRQESSTWSQKGKIPILKNYVFYAICTLDRVIDFPSSNLFVANVVELECDTNNPILCYSRRGYGRFVPKWDENSN